MFRCWSGNTLEMGHRYYADFQSVRDDQLWSYYWSRILWVNKTSVTLVMLLTAQTDKLTDKDKEVCHDRQCFGFRNKNNNNNNNFDRNSSTQLQPGSVHAAYLQRTAGYFSVDTAHNTDCSWKWSKIERYVVTFKLRLPIKTTVRRINAALTYNMRRLKLPHSISRAPFGYPDWGFPWFSSVLR